MDTGTDTITFLLTGVLPSVLLFATLITLPTSWGLLILYKWAVVRTMEKQSGHADTSLPSPATESPGAPPETDLTIRVLEPSETPEHVTLPTFQNILLKAPAKASLIYLLAGLGYAAILTLGTLTAGQIPATPTRVGIVTMVYMWPVILAVQFISGTTLRKWWEPMIFYWGLYIFMALIAVIINPDAIFIDIFRLWGVINIPITLVWWIVLNRRLRAVSPLVLIFLLLAVTGSLVMIEAFLYIGLVQNLILMLLRPLDLSGQGLFFGTVVIGFLVFCTLGWLALSWIRRQYQRQEISDQIIVLDALWLFVSVYEGVNLAFEGAGWALTPLLAFLIYKVVTKIGFRWLSRQNWVSNSPCLLLLRVFSLGRRSEKLFEAVSRHWRYLGNIRLIAGPDLATTTIEPNEFMDYVSGKLSNNFIDSGEKLETALAAGKQLPDHDSRHRVQEFFCYDDTWKMVLTRLAQTCQAVLMDLRGFSPENAGCIFEINALIQVIRLHQLVFVVDSTTHTDFLTRTIQDAWQKLKVTSPNHALPEPQLRLFHYDDTKHIALTRLLETLCEATHSETH